ncbi:hypothetical protein P3G55_08055 [Leptospira sp. 96542]|nr:hypothetical protein [Leptospira sp. 96542]
MIWFLRLVGIFFLSFGLLISTQGEAIEEGEWVSPSKMEPLARALYLSYAPKSFRLPVGTEVLEDKRLGEAVISHATSETSPFSLKLETSGFKHYQILKEEYTLESNENSVLIKFRYTLKPKSDPVSKTLFLFFGKSDLNFIKNQKQDVVIPPNKK